MLPRWKRLNCRSSALVCALFLLSCSIPFHHADATNQSHEFDRISHHARVLAGLDHLGDHKDCLKIFVKSAEFDLASPAMTGQGVLSLSLQNIFPHAINHSLLPRNEDFTGIVPGTLFRQRVLLLI